MQDQRQIKSLRSKVKLVSTEFWFVADAGCSDSLSFTSAGISLALHDYSIGTSWLVIYLHSDASWISQPWILSGYLSSPFAEEEVLCFATMLAWILPGIDSLPLLWSDSLLWFFHSSPPS
ncbi:unnamed protein product [Ilex paraguariensis]|uniref:Uncharacterized protein n=1 Tax=Ilex paraguariensis TaxID=185542 RepID=A0ABC8RXE6_9AQUA